MFLVQFLDADEHGALVDQGAHCPDEVLAERAHVWAEARPFVEGAGVVGGHPQPRSAPRRGWGRRGRRGLLRTPLP